MLQPTFRQRTYQWGSCSLSLGSRTLVMGILNVTPDSFSDGGRYNEVDRAIVHVREMVAQGADIIDIGGESTRPGYEPVGAEEELSRIIPVIEALHAEMPHIPISVDTYKAEVGRRALEAGAHILNDIWGCKKDQQMAHVAAHYECPIILMHNRPERQYDDFVQDVKRDLLESAAIAKAAGVKAENIWLDPGIGFAKDREDNLTLMHHLDELGELGYPVLLAASRKRFIRDTLELPVGELAEGTAATTALGIAQGCQIVRVHDIQANVRTARMCDAMLYPR
ncbi:dihydropteroate synthase [Paenibacillus apiarius]|uniref:Dihydropteroate synthase n=1 Tax=Paenibacillus apiarius TaxID=46240 RepID=A0ABT4DZP7_9BACL|nr:dihydropteroate synthase [Paenibacillus apiarius]MCY9517371.1 dihydropteroate synthase [Paenibacillus apiarius]MCY9522827.1 dihydropteroate synthase [Paenibacillus apiarius]MCY9553068.1 dihydropteroate synthase [Paenibacillus apiarius]MCY9558767.1 dihydropteroate synthase [Paenibacillus apiarius]MCY9686256.1 dihydropteroate synthase [Paenibacillus apiarius]